MPRPPALSPSRANDFRQCPLMFRLRIVDQVPEEPSAAALLGTLVHSVLEDLYDAPAPERTETSAVAMLAPTWKKMQESDPTCTTIHASPEDEQAWLNDAATRVRTYFTMENPTRLEPESREVLLEYQLEDGPLLRGILDRVDVAPDGSIRIVDYKTGKKPLERFSRQATFQMRFYALLVARTRARTPALMQLLYLRDGGTVVLRPTDEDLAAIEHEVRELWREITQVATAGQWRPQRSRLCDWCSYQQLCPEFGGTPPPLDVEAVRTRLGIDV